MFLRPILLACLLLLPQLALAAPVPAAKAVYVGEWQGKQMQLHIRQDGKIHYKRGKPDSQFDLSIELQGFEGDSFRAGALFVYTTFVVSKAPYRDGGKWKMVVDGVELTKVE